MKDIKNYLVNESKGLNRTDSYKIYELIDQLYDLFGDNDIDDVINEILDRLSDGGEDKSVYDAISNWVSLRQRK